MSRISAFTIALLLLHGCASSEVDYAPAEAPQEAGYTEQQISENRYRVVFTGNDRSSIETVQNYALLRAAELTVQKDFDHFQVADRTTLSLPADTQSSTALVAQGVRTQTDCGLLGCDTSYSPEFSATEMRSPADDSRYSSNLEIVMGEQVDVNAENTYDAREVIETIRSEI